MHAVAADLEPDQEEDLPAFFTAAEALDAALAACVALTTLQHQWVRKQLGRLTLQGFMAWALDAQLGLSWQQVYDKHRSTLNLPEVPGTCSDLLFSSPGAWALDANLEPEYTAGALGACTCPSPLMAAQLCWQSALTCMPGPMHLGRLQRPHATP